jgi:hypothetical protein
MKRLTPDQVVIAKKLAVPLEEYAKANGWFANKNIKIGKLGGSFTIHLNTIEAARMAYALKYNNKPTRKLLSIFEEICDYIEYHHPLIKKDKNENNT